MFDEKKEKEFVIKFKAWHIKAIIYSLLVVVLAGVIIAQYYWYPNCSRCKECSSAVTDTIEVAADIPEPLPAIQEPEETVVVQEELKEAVNEESAVKNSTNTSVNTDSEESELLPITGEVYITIDKINKEVRDAENDYAAVTSVKFTIKNQNKDFTPHIKAYLTSDIEDIKEVDLPLLKAGESITQTEDKFFFGYKEIDKEKTIKLELYEGKKLLKSVSQSFKTS